MPPDNRGSTQGARSAVSWRKDLAWKLILVLGALQVVPASLALFKLNPTWVELTIGTVLAVVWVAVLRWQRVQRPFLSGFFVGLTSGVVTALVQGAFVQLYMDHHPNLLATNPEASMVAWAASIVGVSLVGGIVAGLITGGLAWVVDKVGSKRQQRSTA